MVPPKFALADDPYLTVAEVADRLGVTKKTVWTGIREGTLPAPSYIVLGAPRWRASWIDQAAEGKRMSPREAMQQRRAHKFTRRAAEP